ncbi:hypothetical protein J6590_000980 [Homalodisca vitripennis]|nr:hypothetical protein J6590_000980 [Homalodisca vitripennis]
MRGISDKDLENGLYLHQSRNSNIKVYGKVVENASWLREKNDVVQTNLADWQQPPTVYLWVSSKLTQDHRTHVTALVQKGLYFFKELNDEYGLNIGENGKHQEHLQELKDILFLSQYYLHRNTDNFSGTRECGFWYRPARRDRVATAPRGEESEKGERLSDPVKTTFISSRVTANHSMHQTFHTCCKYQAVVCRQPLDT